MNRCGSTFHLLLSALADGIQKACKQVRLVSSFAAMSGYNPSVALRGLKNI
jgi:hypothetical protein